jgi:RNA polymerase sigma-70 factor (ECF subfamily)
VGLGARRGAPGDVQGCLIGGGKSFSVQILYLREYSFVLDDQSAEKRIPVNDDERYEVFVRLVMKHEPRVRSFLRGLLPTWHDVEEVAQEASLIAWRKFDDFEEGTSFGGWLLTIARFEALKYRRRVARSPLVFVDEVWDQLAEEASGEEDQQIRRQHLEICLGKLGSPKRDLLLHVHTHGVVMRKVAEESGKSEQAFYKVIQRLRAVVLGCIKKEIAMEGA